MTADEWGTCADPRQMLRFLFFSRKSPTDARRIRLFAVACCQRVANRLPSEACQRAIETAEEFAHIPPTHDCARRGREQMQHRPVAGIAAQAVANAVICAMGSELLLQLPAHEEWVNTYRTEYVINAHWWCLEAVYQESVYSDPPDFYRWVNDKAKESRAQSELVRCIFGNPFRPVAFDPAWRTSDVVALAKGIYDDRAFDRLPILADALQDAGCTNDDVLNHCRNDRVHARGCWVVDLVLGKA